MHDSAYRLGELVMRTYSDLPNARILEIGSLNVNGCLRDAAMATTYYIGLDLEEGPSVDMVIAPGADLPVADDDFDLVMASSVFEHDARFWDTFMRMCRAARPGGHIYINAPSNGTVHRYPVDCWRFYPDAGLALAEYARSLGMEIDLVESFVGNRHSDVWNDFVAVFRKGPSSAPLNTAFVYQRYPSLNARTWQSGTVYHESASTEDMILIDQLRNQAAAQGDHGGTETRQGEIEAELHHARASLGEAEARLGQLEADNTRLAESVAEAEARAEQMITQREQLGAGVATLESTLRQRREEIDQAWAHATELTQERDELRLRIADLEAGQQRLVNRAAEADSWVFNLAAERRTLEQRLARVQSEFDRAHGTIEKLRAAMAGERNQGAVRDEVQRTTRAEIDRLREEKAALHKDVEALLARLEQLGSTGSDNQVNASNDALQKLREEALDYHSKAARALEQVKLLQLEGRQQERKLQAAHAGAAGHDRNTAWMQRLYLAIERANSGWSAVLPPAIRRQRLARRLLQEGLFDGEAYLQKYPDVAEAGMDPLRHYVLHGLAEGRFVDQPG